MNVSPDQLAVKLRPQLMCTDFQCKKCIDDTQRTCKRCSGGYCLIHNEGSTKVAVRLPSSAPGFETTTNMEYDTQCDCKALNLSRYHGHGPFRC
jgi:hypothetical protein